MAASIYIYLDEITVIGIQGRRRRMSRIACVRVSGEVGAVGEGDGARVWVQVYILPVSDRSRIA